MNELDVLDIELLCYLVEDDIRRCKADEEKKLFDLRLLQHKLEAMKRKYVMF